MNHQKTLRTALCTALIAVIALGLCAPAFAAPWTLTATPSSISVAQGALVTISGTVADNAVGASGVLVTVQITDSASNLAYSTIATSASDGSYSAQYRITPSGPTGTYTVNVYAAQGGTPVASTVASFAVTPATTLTMTPQWAAPGASITYAGTGFTASSAYTVILSWSSISVRLASGTATAGGAISGTFSVPAIAAGVYTVTVNDTVGLLGVGSFGVGQADLTSLQNTLNSLGANVTAVQTLLTSVSGVVNTINGNTASLSTSIGAVSTAVSNLNAQISSINSGIAQVQTSVGSLSTTLANLDAKLVALNGTMATISTSIGTVQTDISNLDTKVTTNGNNIATIQTNIGTIQGEMATSADVTTITTDIGTLSGKIDTLQADVTSTKDATSSLSPLIIVAIVLALIAAIAAIASIVLMRRKIAG